MWSSHTVEYYLVTRDSILMYVRSWMNLQNMLVNETRYKKPHVCDSIYMKCLESIETES